MRMGTNFSIPMLHSKGLWNDLYSCLGGHSACYFDYIHMVNRERGVVLRVQGNIAKNRYVFENSGYIRVDLDIMLAGEDVCEGIERLNIIFEGVKNRLVKIT